MSSRLPINTWKMVMHAKMLWKPKIHIRMYQGCFQGHFPKSALKRSFTLCPPYRKSCASLGLLLLLLHNPLFIFFFFTIRIPPGILSWVWIPTVRKQILIFQGLATKVNLPVGKTMAQACGFPLVHWGSLSSRELLSLGWNSQSVVSKREYYHQQRTC